MASMVEKRSMFVGSSEILIIPHNISPKIVTEPIKKKRTPVIISIMRVDPPVLKLRRAKVIADNKSVTL